MKGAQLYELEKDNEDFWVGRKPRTKDSAGIYGDEIEKV